MHFCIFAHIIRHQDPLMIHQTYFFHILRGGSCVQEPRSLDLASKIPLLSLREKYH